MKLVSPVAHTVHRRFPDPKNSANGILKEFVFAVGVPVEVPDDYAKSLEATNPDRYYNETEWKEYLEAQGLKQKQYEAEEEAKIPTLDELKAKDGATLKALADELGVPYAQNTPPKSIAQAIFTFLNVKKAVEEEGSIGSFTVAQLKEKLDELEVEYPLNAKKADLVALLEEKVKQTIEE